MFLLSSIMLRIAFMLFVVGQWITYSMPLSVWFYSHCFLFLWISITMLYNHAYVYIYIHNIHRYLRCTIFQEVHVDNNPNYINSLSSRCFPILGALSSGCSIAFFRRGNSTLNFHSFGVLTESFQHVQGFQVLWWVMGYPTLTPLASCEGWLANRKTMLVISKHWGLTIMTWLYPKNDLDTKLFGIRLVKSFSPAFQQG